MDIKMTKKGGKYPGNLLKIQTRFLEFFNIAGIPHLLRWG